MRPTGRTAVRGLLLALGALLLTEPALGLTEIEGRREATFRWSPASGAVTAYLVQVSRSGGPFQNDGLTPASSPEYRVRASYGERVAIRVAAVGGEGARSEFSTPSETVRFVRASAGGGGSGGGPGSGPDGGTGGPAEGDARPAAMQVKGRLVEVSDPNGALVSGVDAIRRSDGGGQPYSLHFFYDPGAPDELPHDAQTGSYRPTSGFLSFATSGLSALCGEQRGKAVRFLVVDDVGTPARRSEDLFSASSEECTNARGNGAVVREANVLFTDSRRSAIRNDALADAGAALDRFESAAVEIRGCPASRPRCDLDREGFSLTGNVQFVPEPAAGLLAPAALGALAFLAERRRRRT